MTKCANCKETIDNNNTFKNLCTPCQREFYHLLHNFNKHICAKNAFLLVEFCNNAHLCSIEFYKDFLSHFHYIWDPKLKRFFREEKSEKVLREELDICHKFLKFFENLLTANNFIPLSESSHNFTYLEKVWLYLYAYLSYSKMPHSIKILFSMLCSSIYYSDDKILSRLKKINHFWIYNLSIYLMKDLIDEDFNLKELIEEDIIIPLNKILTPQEENKLDYF